MFLHRGASDPSGIENFCWRIQYTILGQLELVKVQRIFIIIAIIVTLDSGGSRAIKLFPICQFFRDRVSTFLETLLTLEKYLFTFFTLSAIQMQAHMVFYSDCCHGLDPVHLSTNCSGSVLELRQISDPSYELSKPHLYNLSTCHSLNTENTVFFSKILYRFFLYSLPLTPHQF